MRISPQYKKPLGIALVLHLVLLLALLWQIPAPSKIGLGSLANQPRIIHAKTVKEDPLLALEAAKRKVAHERAVRLAKERRLREARARAHALALKKAAEAKKKLAQERARKMAVARQAIEHKKALAKVKKEKLAKLKATQEKLQKQLQQDALSHEAKQVASRQAQALQGIVNQYMAQVKAAIAQNWHQPFQNKSLASVYEVHLAPGGVVLSVELSRTSGNAVLDRSGRLAILKASPLPVPKNPAAFDAFRVFTIRMTPEGPVA